MVEDQSVSLVAAFEDHASSLVVVIETKSCIFQAAASPESVGVFVVRLMKSGEREGDEDAASVVSIIRTDGPVEPPTRKEESVDEV